MRLQTRRFLKAWLLGVVLCLAVPGSAWAAEGSLLTIGKLTNLILVISVLIWIARKPLANFFASRSQAIRDQIAEAQNARREAEERLAEINARMSSLDDELAEIKAAAEKEAREESQRLLAEAERDAQKIIERTRREIEGMTRAAQFELKAHVAELSVQLAREKIQGEMTEDDRNRLFTRFIDRLGGRE
jgi:F-type H+-transporting ATPase subunit b